MLSQSSCPTIVGLLLGQILLARLPAQAQHLLAADLTADVTMVGRKYVPSALQQ